MIPSSYRWPFIGAAVVCLVLYALTYNWEDIQVYAGALGIAWVVSWILFAAISYVLIKAKV